MIQLFQCIHSSYFSCHQFFSFASTFAVLFVVLSALVHPYMALRSFIFAVCTLVSLHLIKLHEVLFGFPKYKYICEVHFPLQTK